MGLNILIDEQNHKFYAVQEGFECNLMFVMVDSKTIDLYHTEVPKELGGRGYAADLAQFAVGYAREKGLKIIATCPFIKGYFDKHPELEDLLA